MFGKVSVYLTFISFCLICLINPSPAYAAVCSPSMVVGNPEIPQTVLTGQDLELKVNFDPTMVRSISNIGLLLTSDNTINPWNIYSDTLKFDPQEMIRTGQNTLTFKFKGSDIMHPYNQYKIKLQSYSNIGNVNLGTKTICEDLGTIKIVEANFMQIGEKCKISLPDNINVDSKDFKLTYSVPDVNVFYAVLVGPPDKINPTGQTTYYKATSLALLNAELFREGIYSNDIKPTSGTLDFLSRNITGYSITGYSMGNYRAALNAWVYRGSGVGGYYHGFTCAHKDFKVSNLPTSAVTEGKSIAPVTAVNNSSKTSGVDCAETPNRCSNAAGLIKETSGGRCIETAIGCIPINLEDFINRLLRWSGGLAGGIAFLMMIFGSLQMITSQGNADQLKKGREQFIAAISGLLFIIFSITLLQIIGADILNIFPR